MAECIYCSNQQTEKQFPIVDMFGDTYHFYRCPICGTWFLNPMPSEAQFLKAYDEAYYGEGDKKFNPVVEKVVDWFRKQNAKKLANLFGGKGTVLDIGCGNGNLLHYLGLAGAFDLHGIEPDGKSADRTANFREIILKRGFLEQDTYLENTFDGITLIHVLEHLPNPREVIEIIASILKPSGHLVIEIPNVRSWQAKIFKSKWLHFDPPRHLNMFEPNQLIKILSDKGFQLQSESYFSPQYNPFGVQQSFLNLILNKREVLYEHLKGNKNYTKEYSSFSLFLQQLFHWLTFPIFVFTDLIAALFKRGATVKLVFQKSTK